MKRLELPPQGWLLGKFEDAGTHLVSRHSGERVGGNGEYQRVRVTYAGKRALYLAHRLLFKMRTGLEPAFVDHRNGDTQMNEQWNLRAADAKTNGANSGSVGSASGVKNVYPRGAGYYAMVCSNRVYYRGETRATIAEAEADAYALREQHHGDFARHT